MVNELPWTVWEGLAANCIANKIRQHLQADGRFSAIMESIGQSETPDCWSLFERTMEQRAAQFGKQRWGIKDPLLTPHLPILARHYPQARFIVIIRDPRAVTASYLRHSWFVANSFHGAKLWRDAVLAQLQFARMNPSQATVVRYDALVANPEPEIRKLCEFAGVPFSESMLENRKEFGISVNEFNKNAFRPVDSSIAERWKGELSPRQVKVVESVTASIMYELGMKPQSSPEPLPKLSKWGYRIHQALVHRLRWHWKVKLKSSTGSTSRTTRNSIELSTTE